MKLTFFDPGQLRTQVTLQNAVETPDGCGGFNVSWADVANCWVAVRSTSAQIERFAARQQQEATHRITMRFRSDVQPGQRLRKGAVAYRIQMVSDLDETGRYLVCFVLEERS